MVKTFHSSGFRTEEISTSVSAAPRVRSTSQRESGGRTGRGAGAGGGERKEREGKRKMMGGGGV